MITYTSKKKSFVITALLYDLFTMAAVHIHTEVIREIAPPSPHKKILYATLYNYMAPGRIERRSTALLLYMYIDITAPAHTYAMCTKPFLLLLKDLSNLSIRLACRVTTLEHQTNLNSHTPDYIYGVCTCNDGTQFML